MITLVLATRNRHKITEIRDILSARFRYVALPDLANAPAAIENASTFAGNATKKAVQLSEWLSGSHDFLRIAGAKTPQQLEQVFVMADDSGLEVDALNGAPGVHSARFAADSTTSSNSPDAANNAKLLQLLRDVPPPGRTARFRCVIALTPVLSPGAGNASPVCCANETEMQTQLFEGTCEGRIAETASGSQGFGYDPLFVPDGFDRSFAALAPSIKNTISHRARALAKVREFFDRIL